MWRKLKGWMLAFVILEGLALLDPYRTWKYPVAYALFLAVLMVWNAYDPWRAYRIPGKGWCYRFEEWRSPVVLAAVVTGLVVASASLVSDSLLATESEQD